MASTTERAALEHRVLVLAPTGRDAQNSHAVLGMAGIASVICPDIDALCDEIVRGAGAILLTEEALSAEGVQRLSRTLRDQPSWSDLPIALLTRGGPDSPVALQAMEAIGNVVVLERPVRVSTLVIALRTALRSRVRQYLSRGHLAALQDADHRKDEFLAMLAHELRNPLAPIRNALQLFQRLVPADAPLQRMRQIVERQVEQLTRLVDDLLDVSRITRGKIDLRMDRFDLAAIVARAVETSRPALDDRRQHLTIALPDEAVFVDGDLTRLAQVVGNLLNNAAKYTPEGGHVWLTASGDGETATIRVRDDGMGIPEDMLPRVFELFTQVETSLDRSQGGLGIGLTLVRRIVEMHGGRVEASSAGPGKGSEFVVQLPARVAPGARAAPGAEPSSPDPARRRVLVVDDNADSAESLAMLLELLHHDVRTAHDGTAALAVAREFRPNVVVLDIGLPGMDGYQVAARMRGEEYGNPVLIALTGYGQSEDRRRTAAAGFHHHLTKPAHLETLQRLLVEAAA